MKLKGIYYNPRKKMMMIKAVVRKVKQKSMLSQKRLLVLVIKGAFLLKKSDEAGLIVAQSHSLWT